MINNKDLISEVELFYLKNKNQREFEQSVVEEKLLNSPDYYNLSCLLSSAIFECQKAEFLGQTEAYISLKENINNLKIKKENLRKQLNINENLYKPNCAICNDTGEVNYGKCQCFYDKLTNVCYDQLGILSPNLVDFSDDKLSYVNKTELYFEKLQTYAKTFKEGSKNLVFMGKTGVGKTFLAKAITKGVLKNRHTALFVTAQDLNNIAIDNMHNTPYAEKLATEILTTCDFLVIDDLGAEKILNKITAENLYTIISIRQELSLPYLITTNLTYDEIGIKYGDRVFSRLTNKNTVTFAFDGTDLRKI